MLAVSLCYLSILASHCSTVYVFSPSDAISLKHHVQELTGGTVESRCQNIQLSSLLRQNICLHILHLWCDKSWIIVELMTVSLSIHLFSESPTLSFLVSLSCSMFSLSLTFSILQGIILSGGQRQRISVARALYQSTNVVFLVSPLFCVCESVCVHVCVCISVCTVYTACVCVYCVCVWLLSYVVLIKDLSHRRLSPRQLYRWHRHSRFRSSHIRASHRTLPGDSTLTHLPQNTRWLGKPRKIWPRQGVTRWLEQAAFPNCLKIQ